MGSLPGPPGAHGAWDTPGSPALSSPHACHPPASPMLPDPAWGCRLSPAGDLAARRASPLDSRHRRAALPSVPVAALQVPAPAPSTTRARPASPPASRRVPAQHEGSTTLRRPARSRHTQQLRRLLQVPQKPCARSPEPAHPQRAAPEPAGLTSSAGDPHLVAIEQGAALGREEAQISCGTKEGRGMSAAERRPRRPSPSASSAAEPSLGVQRHRITPCSFAGTGEARAGERAPPFPGLSPPPRRPLSPLPAAAVHSSRSRASPASLTRGRSLQSGAAQGQGADPDAQPRGQDHPPTPGHHRASTPPRNGLGKRAEAPARRRRQRDAGRVRCVRWRWWRDAWRGQGRLHSGPHRRRQPCRGRQLPGPCAGTRRSLGRHPRAPTAAGGIWGFIAGGTAWDSETPRQQSSGFR